MAGRSCHTCRHFEPAPLWRRGWCRNPRLYALYQSHLVAESELGCGFGTGTHWQPTSDTPLQDVVRVEDSAEPADINQKRQSGPRQPLQFVKAQTLLGAIPGVNAAMSTGSGFGSGGGSGRENRGDDSWTPSSGRPSEPDDQSTTYSAPRSDRTTRPAGQERTVSYQPEERYWTDYLRIALPVVGLLLMLGLFLFWANKLIDPGDDSSGANVVISETQTAEVIGAASPVATATVAPNLTANARTEPTTAPADQGATVATATSAPAAAEDPTATAEPAETDGGDTADAEFQIDQGVQVNDTTVNLRAEANTTADVVMVLDELQQMTVTDGPVAGENYSWYQVQFENTDGETVQGWVASDFIEAS